MSLPDLVRFRLDNGEECPAVVTKWRNERIADLRVILSADQAVRYGGDGWWNPDYLRAHWNIPPECLCEIGTEPGSFYIP